MCDIIHLTLSHFSHARRERGEGLAYETRLVQDLKTPAHHHNAEQQQDTMSAYMCEPPGGYSTHPPSSSL